MMVEKGIRGGICQAVYRYTKPSNKYMNDYDKDVKSSYLHGFEWVEEDDLLKFSGSFIKNYDEKSDKGYVFEVDVEYPKNLH